MTAYEQRRYSDPLEFILSEEAKTCKGCIHEYAIPMSKDGMKVCTYKGKQHGKRCKKYKEKV